MKLTFLFDTEVWVKIVSLIDPRQPIKILSTQNFKLFKLFKLLPIMRKNIEITFV